MGLPWPRFGCHTGRPACGRFPSLCGVGLFVICWSRDVLHRFEESCSLGRVPNLNEFRLNVSSATKKRRLLFPPLPWLSPAHAKRISPFSPLFPPLPHAFLSSFHKRTQAFLDDSALSSTLNTTICRKSENMNLKCKNQSIYKNNGLWKKPIIQSLRLELFEISLRPHPLSSPLRRKGEVEGKCSRPSRSNCDVCSVHQILWQ